MSWKLQHESDEEKHDQLGPQPGKVARQGREQKQHATISAMKLPKDHASLMTLILKGPLRRYQVLSLIWATCDKRMLDAESSEVVMMRKACQAYSEAARNNGKVHRHGPPALHFFNGWLE